MSIIAIASILYITLYTDGLDRSNSISNQNIWLFPSLLTVVDEINQIQIQLNNEQLILKKLKGSWVLNTADNYPANIPIIKKFLLQLTGIKIIKTKTSKETEYRALGVNSLEQEGYDRYQITIYKNQNEVIQSFLIKKDFHENNRTFMRKINQKEVYETEGQLELTMDKINWLDANIINVSSNKIKRVTVDTPEEKFTLARREGSLIHFKIDGLDKNLEEKSQISTSTLAAFMESLRFNDVKEKSLLKNAQQLSRFRFDLKTKNQSIEVIDYQTKLGIFTEFNLVGGPPSKDSNFVNPELIKQFVFKLPQYKRRLLNRRLSDLTKKKTNK